jgi:SNF2 family DNA or RNA helicase
MLISRTATAEFLDRKLSNYLWMKGLTPDDILRELKCLKVRPVFKTTSWLHQLVCFYIGLREPRFLFLLDMGLGKSKILADLMTQAQREKKLTRALVTVPRIINLDSWVDDLAKHSELEPWSVNVPDTDEKWERLSQPKGDVTLIDLASLNLAVCTRVKKSKGKGYALVRNPDRVAHLQKVYNFVSIDECHKLGNTDSLWFEIVNQLSRKADYCYGATGTLFGKQVEKLWPPFYVVDRGETFGPNLGLFRSAFFTAKTMPWKGTVYTYKTSMDTELHRMLQHRSIRYDEAEVKGDLPERVHIQKHYYMADDQREHYLRALEGLIDASGSLEVLDSAWLRMRQIVSGYLAWKDEHGAHVLHFKKNPKLDGLESLLEEMLQDSKVVVCYDYTETGRMISNRLTDLGIAHEWFYGGTKDKSGSRRRFMEDPKCRVFVMNSEAGGTGNDGLQGVAKYMIFYETPTPPTTKKQTWKRIHRNGQKHRSFIYDLVMKSSCDTGILKDLEAGIDTHDRVVNGKGKRDKNFFLLG